MSDEKIFYKVVIEGFSDSTAKCMGTAGISLFRFYPNKDNNRLVNHKIELASLSRLIKIFIYFFYIKRYKHTYRDII